MHRFLPFSFTAPLPKKSPFLSRQWLKYVSLLSGFSTVSLFIPSHRVTGTEKEKLVQIIVISEVQGHLHFSFWNTLNGTWKTLVTPTADGILLLSALDCSVNWHFVDSTSLQSPFLYNFNSPSAWISRFYCRWLYSSAQPIFEKQCHALLLFLFYSMSYLIPILPLQTQLG